MTAQVRSTAGWWPEMGSSNSTNLILCSQDFYSNRALLAVSTVRCNHDSVVIYHEPAKIQNNILLLSCLFSAYTFFLLLLFSRWLVETFYSVWGFIPGSEMIQLSLSECCLDKAFARHSATTELEKVCNFTEVTKIKKIKKKLKKPSKAERRTSEKCLYEFWFHCACLLAAYRLAGWRALLCFGQNSVWKCPPWNIPSQMN